MVPSKEERPKNKQNGTIIVYRVLRPWSHHTSVLYHTQTNAALTVSPSEPHRLLTVCPPLTAQAKLEVCAFQILPRIKQPERLWMFNVSFNQPPACAHPERLPQSLWPKCAVWKLLLSQRDSFERDFRGKGFGISTVLWTQFHLQVQAVRSQGVWRLVSIAVMRLAKKCPRSQKRMQCKEISLCSLYGCVPPENWLYTVQNTRET